MKIIATCLTCLLFSFSGFAQTTETFHDFWGITILGDTLNFSDYYGKKVLVVNTASYCGYTPQYTELEQLDSLYAGNNFAIIGFPCNDFGGQEPFDDSTINNFCTGIYSIKFQMMSKISVTAPDTVEVYKWLQLQNRNGVADAPVTWNFHKFLIDEAGHWVAHFPSPVSPLDTVITNWINSPSVLAVPSLHSMPEIKLLTNPVQDFIQIKITCEKPTMVDMKIYSLQGELIANLFDGNTDGNTLLKFNTEKLSNGVYFLITEIAGHREAFKVCVLK